VEKYVQKNTTIGILFTDDDDNNDYDNVGDNGDDDA